MPYSNSTTYLEMLKGDERFDYLTHIGICKGEHFSQMSVILKEADLLCDTNNHCLAFFSKVLDDGCTVNLTILSKADAGWDSLPLNPKGLGDSTGRIQLSIIFSALPEYYKDSKGAAAFLAKNPDRLVSQLTNVLTHQSKTIAEQRSIISMFDWNLSSVYTSVNQKAKSMITLLCLCKPSRKWLPVTSKHVENEKDR